MSSSNAKIGSPSPTIVTVAGAQDPDTLAQPLLVDADGNLLISGSITANNPSVGPNGAAIPADSTLIGGKNGSGNLTPVVVDASGNVGVNVISEPSAARQVDITKISGAVPAATNPLPSRLTDGTSFYKATTPSDTQPVSAVSLPLPTGASTAALQTSGNTSLSSIDTKTPALVAGRVPVDGSGSTQPVSGTVAVSNFPATQPISAVALPLPTGAATESTLSTLNGKVTACNTGAVTISAALPAGANAIGSVSVSNFPATQAVTQSGTWTVQPGNTANTTAWLVKELVATSSSVTSVASSASSVSLLALNASRLGATFYNDSTAVLYLKLGATASATSYTVQMAAGSYYELPTPHLYTGAIDGIWASANGNVRITELS